MIVAEDLLLLLTDDASGKSVVDSTRLDLALAGGILLELATLGHVDVAGAGEQVKAGRLVVRDPRSTGDDVLDAALQRVSDAGPTKPEHVLRDVAKGLREGLYGRLIARGILRAEEGRVLGIFPTRSWPAVDSAHEHEVRTGLQEVLVSGRPPSQREAALIALLHAVGQVPKVVGPVAVSRRELRRRAKEVAEGSFAEEAVRRAVEAVTAATTMVVMMAATSAAAGSSS